MLTVIIIALVLGVGFIMFSSLQPELPKELAFLRIETVPTTGASAPAVKRYLYKGWDIRQSADTVELYKPFEGQLVLNGRTFNTPAIGILCHANKLDIRIDSKEPTTGIKSSEVLKGTVREAWTKGTGTNLFPSAPSALLRELTSGPPTLSLTLSYRDLGLQASTLSTEGLTELVKQLPTNCQ